MSVLVGGDSSPPGEQDTITRYALLFLYIVCIVFLLSCLSSVAICGG